MKLFLGTIPILLYMHLVFRMLYFSGEWDPVQVYGLIAGITLFAFGMFVPVLLMYPGYLERFTGKRPVFLILIISIVSLIWAPTWGLIVADMNSQLEQPLVIESSILYFISFNLLYSYVFQLYEKLNFYVWWKQVQGTFFYNDPPTHIRDFDKTASIYIGILLVVMVLVVVMVFGGYGERRRWNKQRLANPIQESRIVVLQPTNASTIWVT